MGRPKTTPDAPSNNEGGEDRAEALVKKVRASAVTCPACGELCVEKDAAFCSSCGAKLRG